MTSLDSSIAPEALHPSLWRASQLASATTGCIDTGFPVLSRQLPGGGWPTGVLIDLLPQQVGVGELRLLRPALQAVGSPALARARAGGKAGAKAGAKAGSIVLLQPPHAPQALALAALGLPPEQLVWVRSSRSSDVLWATEQVLRSGSCAAVLLWQQHARGETLRRLHLAAQHGEALFFMLRPIACAQDASPAPLRLALRPQAGGMDIHFIKRRGPQRDTSLFLPLTPSLLQRHAPLDRLAPVPAPARRISPQLVE